MKKTLSLILIVCLALTLNSPVYANAERKNPYDSLKAPSYITKIGSEYFIVDCYNNQIIYNQNLTDEIGSWNVMTAEINLGHTIASDGMVYLVDDTENHRILVMERRINHEGKPVFEKTQVFNEIGIRPHYVHYDEKTNAFYAWSSMTGEMYLFRRNPETNLVYLDEVIDVAFISKGTYVRSFTIIDDTIYFVSGNAAIMKADLKTMRLIKAYPVPEHIAGMVKLVKIEDFYYLTVSTDFHGNQDFGTILRTADLSSLIHNEYEDIYDYFKAGGTPYNMTQINNRWYLVESGLPGYYVWSFRVEDNAIRDVKLVY
ncbi:MAG: hypothetical protein FWG91_08545 [Lachnospiraceae bacterium]|nr:hypothetical protein [Lachnospiraceae bacterium]